MEYLYVCHFSNGHIKVGRSIDPRARIAAHADRVACMGVELVDHHIAECVGRSAPAETALIERCLAGATKRNKSEWFEGLDYQDVCAWLSDISVQQFVSKEIAATQSTNWGAIINGIRAHGGLTQGQIAVRVGSSQGAISDLANYRTKDPNYVVGAALMTLLDSVKAAHQGEVA